MRSLRLQLLCGTTLASAAVLLACGLVLYFLISRALWADFDAALIAKAQALGSLVEHDSEGFESDLPTAPLHEFRAAGGDEYYQIWLPDGSAFLRSPSLGGMDLARGEASSDPVDLGTIRLPDGRPGRQVQIRFAPRHEELPRLPEVQLTLVLARGTHSVTGTLVRVRGLLLGVGVLALALSAAALAWVLRRNLRPLARVGDQIAALDEREFHRPLDGAGLPDELAPIVARLNGLLERVGGAFERERRFTGDVAHELRTPLAGMRLKLELALAREREPAAYRATIQECLAVGLQLQTLVENLLHLARADAGQLEFRREAVDLAALAREAWSSVAESAAARRLEPQWRLPAALPLVCDPDALRLILRNLLDNAVAYAPEGTRIRITAAQVENRGQLELSNQSDFDARDLPRIFERFWRADAVRHEGNGTRYGLGLPLCRTLLEALGGGLAATLRDGQFVITLYLPVARAHHDAG